MSVYSGRFSSDPTQGESQIANAIGRISIPVPIDYTESLQNLADEHYSAMRDARQELVKGFHNVVLAIGVLAFCVACCAWTLVLR